MTPDEEDRCHEDYEIDVIIGAKDKALKSEEKALRFHLDNKSLPNRPIMSTCNNPKCRHDNNITKNRSIFCSECGSLLTDRHY